MRSGNDRFLLEQTLDGILWVAESLKGALIVSKVLYCNDLVPGCKFEAHGDSEEEIMAATSNHIATVHNLTDISDKILAMVCDAIQEEVRTRTRANSRFVFARFAPFFRFQK